MTKRIATFGNIAIKKCKHGIFAYNVNDLYVGKSLEYYGEWTDNELVALESLIHPGNIVVDIGAYIGTHSIFFAKKIAPTGLVFSLEPQRIIYNLLCTNVALNNLINIRCLNVAASDETGFVTIPVLDPATKQNFGNLRIDKYNKGEKVAVIKLDDLHLPRCSLIKVDTEGFEAKVLRGAKLTIDKYHPVLYVENNTTNYSEEILKVLEELGYQCFWHFVPYFQEGNFFSYNKDVFNNNIEINLLCFPNNTKVKMEGFLAVKNVNDNWKKALERFRINTK
ncbi:MAG: hypothetical protein A2Z35_03685 [Actinobacteria bacterium RBG_19FT_COMBO_36_27]|nr:MAG: hypothetical protein A2Z35_03685 [Actinobacteria bacterium RBG_19FT_COMBO_36_27]